MSGIIDRMNTLELDTFDRNQQQARLIWVKAEAHPEHINIHYEAFHSQKFWGRAQQPDDIIFSLSMC